MEATGWEVATGTEILFRPNRPPLRDGRNIRLIEVKAIADVANPSSSRTAMEGCIAHRSADAEGTLCRCHGSRRPNRQLQRLAQSSKIGITWAAMIRFPKIDASRANAHLFSNFGNR